MCFFLELIVLFTFIWLKVYKKKISGKTVFQKEEKGSLGFVGWSFL